MTDTEKAEAELLGTLLNVHEGADVQMYHIFSSIDEPFELHHKEPVSHILISVEPGVTVQFHEYITSEQDCHCSVELYVADNAHVTFTSFQNANAEHVQVRQRSKLGAHASVRWCNVTLGGQQVEHDLCNDIAGQHSESSVDWLFYAKEAEQQKISARNMFNASHGGGQMLMKGVAEHRAHVVCNGMIDIGLQGGDTDTYLTEDVLMLDSTAQVDAIPGLEIKTNEVKASHSATVKRLAPDDLFYFECRGIPEQTARHMYVVGFLEAVTNRVDDPDLAQAVHEMVEAKYLMKAE